MKNIKVAKFEEMWIPTKISDCGEKGEERGACGKCGSCIYNIADNYVDDWLDIYCSNFSTRKFMKYFQLFADYKTISEKKLKEIFEKIYKMEK